MTDLGTSASTLTNGFDKLPTALVPTDDEVKQMEQAAVVASEVTNAVLSQRLQLEEKQRSIVMLQKALVRIITVNGLVKIINTTKIYLMRII